MVITRHALISNVPWASHLRMTVEWWFTSSCIHSECAHISTGWELRHASKVYSTYQWVALATRSVVVTGYLVTVTAAPQSHMWASCLKLTLWCNFCCWCSNVYQWNTSCLVQIKYCRVCWLFLDDVQRSVWPWPPSMVHWVIRATRYVGQHTLWIILLKL